MIGTFWVSAFRRKSLTWFFNISQISLPCKKTLRYLWLWPSESSTWNQILPELNNETKAKKFSTLNWLNFIMKEMPPKTNNTNNQQKNNNTNRQTKTQTNQQHFGTNHQVPRSYRFWIIRRFCWEWEDLGFTLSSILGDFHEELKCIVLVDLMSTRW